MRPNLSAVLSCSVAIVALASSPVQAMPAEDSLPPQVRHVPFGGSLNALNALNGAVIPANAFSSSTLYAAPGIQIWPSAFGSLTF